MEVASDIPLYESGSLGSLVLDLGIGQIILSPHIDGIRTSLKADVKKHMEKQNRCIIFQNVNWYKIDTKCLSFFACSIACLTSKIEI